MWMVDPAQDSGREGMLQCANDSGRCSGLSFPAQEISVLAPPARVSNLLYGVGK